MQYKPELKVDSDSGSDKFRFEPSFYRFAQLWNNRLLYVASTKNWTVIVKNLIEDIDKKATCVTHKPFNHAKIDQLIQL